MYCEKCGAENLDTAAFCEKCGNPMGATEGGSAPQEPVAFNNPIPSNVKTFMPVIAGVAAIVVVLILALTFLKGGPETPVKKFVKAMNSQKSELLLDAVPKQLAKYYKDEDEIMDSLDELVEDTMDSMEDEYGKGKFSYKILDKDKLDKDDLEDFEDRLEDRLQALDIDDDDVKVTAGYELTVKLTYKGKEDDESDKSSLYVYKVDGRWCLSQLLYY